MKANRNAIHIGCGTVYLKGYKNYDIFGQLAKDYPELVKENLTTIDKYYNNKVTKKDFMKGKFHYKAGVCDRYVDARDLVNAEDQDSVDEILAVQLFEHFTFSEGEQLLRDWLGLLRSGGFVRLHVPDTWLIIGGCSRDLDVGWAIRQLYGSQRNEYGIHKSGYTKDSLKELMKECGYKEIEILENMNDYPAFGIKGFK